MGWFELTLIYVVFMVAASVINKKTLSFAGIDELVFGAFVQFFTGIVCLVLAMATGFRFSFNTTTWVMLAGMTLTYIFAVSMYYTGLKRIDLSLETILSSTGAVWSLILGALFLGELFSFAKVLGVGLILLACFVVVWEKKKINVGKYEGIILLSAVFYALGAVWDKRLNEFGTALSYLAISFGLVGFVMLIVYGKRTMAAVKTSFRKPEFWRGSIINGGLYSVAFWALFEAYQRGGEVSRMFPMTLSTAVLVPILGMILLSEHNRWRQKVIALVVMVAGLWMLKG